MIINERQQRELMFYLRREVKKLKEVFKIIKLKNKDRDVTDLFDLAKSYYEDMLFFYKKKEYIKAFELMNYVWGILDSLARLHHIEFPEDIRKWFKVEQ